MKKLLNGVKWFFTNPTCVFCLGLAVVLLATTLEVTRGRNTNYFDYYDSTMLFWSGISPYTAEYCETHCIYFLYSPVFSTLFAPIFMLPWWLGPFVWNIGNYCLFCLAIKMLPEPLAPHRMKIFLFLLSVLLQSIFCFQYNTVVCYIFLFAFTLLERGKPFWAVLLIMLSATTKVYGAAELALLFCYPKVWRNLGYALLCGAGFLLLPAINPAVDNVLTLYQDMFNMIASHHSDSDFVGLLFARGLKPFLLPNYRAVQLGVLAVLGVLFFWRYKRWGDFRFRVQVLAVLMGYIILFSDSPETHTYIIALSGYLMTFWIQPRRTRFDWVLFWVLFVCFGILPTDVLCPAWLHEYIHETFWIDVYAMALAWLLIIWRAVGPAGRSLHAPVRPLAVGLLLILGTATAGAQDKTYSVGGVTFVMKPVKGGTFMMGATHKAQAEADELPAHKATVADFYMGETEVTQALWTAVMGKNPARMRSEQWPVENVSYEDCQKFIDKLNELTGQHFRLPTEAEWEYAARGGRHSKGYVYAGSNDAKAVAWLLADSIDRGHKDVKTKHPNELGLYDMSGGVWEWCCTPYEDYQSSNRHFLTRMARRRFMVIRGGSLENSARYARVSNRYMFADWRHEKTLGLRLAQ